VSSLAMHEDRVARTCHPLGLAGTCSVMKFISRRKNCLKALVRMDSVVKNDFEVKVVCAHIPRLGLQTTLAESRRSRASHSCTCSGKLTIRMRHSSEALEASVLLHTTSTYTARHKTCSAAPVSVRGEIQGRYKGRYLRLAQYGTVSVRTV
jgi:hypothetical protein